MLGELLGATGFERSITIKIHIVSSWNDLSRTIQFRFVLQRSSIRGRFQTPVRIVCWTIDCVEEVEPLVAGEGVDGREVPLAAHLDGGVLLFFSFHLII